jgi:sulfur carrier protein ThiS
LRVKIINVPFKDDGVEEIEIDSISVGDLLKKLEIPVFMVIVTRNGEVVGEHDILMDKDNVQISGMGCC